MAIQFPPVSIGDPEPQDGDTYLYLITQQEFECHRNSLSEAAQWSQKGVINTTSFGYRGTLEIQVEAPTDAEKGNIYSVIDGGLANSSFSGLAGQVVDQWSLIVFADPSWLLINTGYINSSPWVRTIDGKIIPNVATDNLDMLDGNYLINELDEL